MTDESTTNPLDWENIKLISDDLIKALDALDGTTVDAVPIRARIARVIANMRMQRAMK
ncbi:MAG: hypothetical protein ACTSUE_15895 [Promethearchaeota archaeon]